MYYLSLWIRDSGAVFFFFPGRFPVLVFLEMWWSVLRQDFRILVSFFLTWHSSRDGVYFFSWIWAGLWLFWSTEEYGKIDAMPVLGLVFTRTGSFHLGLQEPELPSKKSDYTQGILYDQALSLLEEREAPSRAQPSNPCQGPDMWEMPFWALQINPAEWIPPSVYGQCHEEQKNSPDEPCHKIMRHNKMIVILGH